MPSKSKSKKLVCEIPTEVSSPQNSRQLRQGLSFANLRLTDRTKRPENTTPIRDRPNKIMFPPTYEKYNKENCIKFNSPRSSNNDYCHENYRLMDENERLKHRIQILTEQRDILQQNYTLMKQQKQMIKTQYSKKQQQLKKKKDKYREYKRKSQQYDQIVPKLDELQKLQQEVIQDNLVLQQKEQKLRQALEKILNLTDKKNQSFIFEQYINGQETGLSIQIKNIVVQALQN